MLGVRCLTVNCLWCCVLVESWKQYNRKNRLPSEMKHVKSQLILLGEQGDWQTNLGGFENQIGSFMTGLTMLTNPTRSPDDQSLWPQTKILIGALHVEFC